MVSHSGKPKVNKEFKPLISNQLGADLDSERDAFNDGDTSRNSQGDMRLLPGVSSLPEPADDDDVEADHEAELC